MKQISTLVLVCLLLHASIFSQIPNRYDIVIDELMADPTPTLALPNNEWIELKNVSSLPFSLQGWRISDLSGQSGPMPNFILRPDSFVIVCTASAVTAMSAYGPTISVTSFPSLDNAGDQLALKNAQGKVIHCVAYSDKWYQNELKKEGGWSLEMIDTKNPCSGFSNWKASMDSKGGSPGKKNSNDGTNADKTAPQLLRSYATDSLNVTLVFDEPVDSLGAAITTAYSISEGIGQPLTVLPVAPAFDHINLKTGNALQRNKVYKITVKSIVDCAGNLVEQANVVKLGLASQADSLDLVVNEILFNPRPSGVDYVELYNRSNKVIDLKSIYIANRNTAGAISSITAVSTENYLFFPGEFMVITSDVPTVKKDFVALNPGAFAETISLPSFNDDEGDVVILNGQGRILDELVYKENWHFKLIDNREGIALERIDYQAPTLQQDNWHSAATGVGYGTPTYKNSQFRTDLELKGDITISPEIISPDNDGVDDFATINYIFPAPGYVTSITIFDATGRMVRYLQRNAISGIKGNYRWDGLGEKNQKLPVGVYVIYTAVFNLDGKKKQFKKVIVLARRN